MNDWINPATKTPRDGALVEINVAGRIVGPVLYKDGRFWKFRNESGGGQAYEVITWRPIAKEEKKGKGSE